MGRLTHGEHSHATRDPRRVRGYFPCAHRWTSFRALSALIIFRNAGLRQPTLIAPAARNFGVRELAPAFSTADSSAVRLAPQRVAARESGDESPHSESRGG